MQPGNNYRAAATPLSGDVSGGSPQVTQADADALSVATDTNGKFVRNGGYSGYQVPVFWSKMLTVWRKLHVETDSMGPVTGNEIDEPFTHIVGTGTALTEVYGSSFLDDGSKNLDDVPPENGRFENGTLIVGSAPGAITISPITGNGNKRVVFPATSIAGLPFLAKDKDLTTPKETISGTITEVVKSAGSFVWTLNVTAQDQTPIDWPDFVGGTLSVGGGANVSIVAANGTASSLTTSALNIPCIVRDDDDDTLLPKMPDTSQLAAAYKPAYVVPVFDVGDNNPAVPFVLNVQSKDINTNISAMMDWDSRSLNAPDFWVAYLLEAYQDDTTEDRDPDSEDPPIFGDTEGTGGSLIYLEVHQTHEGIASSIAEEQDTVVHETGHAVADSGVEDATDGASRFLSDYLRRIRSSTKPGS